MVANSSRFISAMRRSPQEVDPLSWFTRPFLPVTFAIAMAITGSLFVLGTLPEEANPAFQLVAVVSFSLACLSVHPGPGPRLVAFRPRHAVIPLALCWLGLASSALGASSGVGDISRWWAPLGVIIILASLAPYSSAVMLGIYGALSTAVCCGVAVLAFAVAADTPWPMLTTFVMAALTPILATIAAALFSAYVVERVLRWSELPIQATLDDNPRLNFAKWNAEQGELKLLSDRVMPFIERIAHDGHVTARDRTDAAELAKEVRDALLDTVDRSWLDSLSTDHRLTVVDPSHLAPRLSRAQRGAVRSLILAVLESPDLAEDSLSIELRDSDGGNVAVALTMKLELPEGKRMMMLAPHYLTLQATVDELVMDQQDQLRLRFQIPAANRIDPERRQD